MKHQNTLYINPMKEGGLGRERVDEQTENASSKKNVVETNI